MIFSFNKNIIIIRFLQINKILIIKTLNPTLIVPPICSLHHQHRFFLPHCTTNSIACCRLFLFVTPSPTMKVEAQPHLHLLWISMPLVHEWQLRLLLFLCHRHYDNSLLLCNQICAAPFLFFSFFFCIFSIFYLLKLIELANWKKGVRFIPV